MILLEIHKISFSNAISIRNSKSWFCQKINFVNYSLIETSINNVLHAQRELVLISSSLKQLMAIAVQSVIFHYQPTFSWLRKSHVGKATRGFGVGRRSLHIASNQRGDLNQGRDNFVFSNRGFELSKCVYFGYYSVNWAKVKSRHR